jgi:hypothetical protein
MEEVIEYACYGSKTEPLWQQPADTGTSAATDFTVERDLTRQRLDGIKTGSASAISVEFDSRMASK